MKFKVFRTRDYFYERGKPCGKAKLENANCRYAQIKYYVIEINSLEELINFVKLHGGIIIDENVDVEDYKDCSKSLPQFSIEIYDGYRE